MYINAPGINILVILFIEWQVSVMRNKLNFIESFILFLLLALISLTVLANDKTPQEKKSEYYQVIGNKVDPATFVGWNVYHNTCVRCHGVGGVGTESAPDLTVSADRLSPAQFRIKVLHKTIVKFTSDDWRSMEQAMFEEIAKQEKRDKGEIDTMPRWEYNPSVNENVHNIYRYLKARADDAIGPDKPGIIK